MTHWFRDLSNLLNEVSNEQLNESEALNEFEWSTSKKPSMHTLKSYGYKEPSVDFSKSANTVYKYSNEYFINVKVSDPKQLSNALAEISNITANGRRVIDARRGGFLKDANGETYGTWGISYQAPKY